MEYPDPGRRTTVAVIGAGASGTLAPIYLLQAATAARIPLRMALIDRYPQHGLGRAYATSNPAHLLNSPVDRMSAVAGDPGHLARWAAANGIRPEDGFLSRPDFGRYLLELLAAAEHSAGPAATVTRVTERQHRHARPAVAGAAVRDHRYSGDPRSGRRAGRQAARRLPRPDRTAGRVRAGHDGKCGLGDVG